MASGSPRRRSRLPCGAGAASNAGGHDTEAAGALLAGDLLSDTQCLALRQRLLTGSEIAVLLQDQMASCLTGWTGHEELRQFSKFAKKFTQQELALGTPSVNPRPCLHSLVSFLLPSGLGMWIQLQSPVSQTVSSECFLAGFFGAGKSLPPVARTSGSDVG